MTRTFALVKKEFYQILRDPSSLLVSFFLPLLLLVIYGYGVSLDMNHLRIGLVLEDPANEATSFANSLTNSPFFSVTIVRHRREIEEKIIAGTIRGIVVIPSYFTQFLKRGVQEAPIQVIADGSEPNTATFVQNYVQGAWQTWLAQERIHGAFRRPIPIRPIPRFWYNEQLESRFFLIPGSLAIIMTLIGTLLTALVVAREWERGTMEALMATPVRMLEMILSKTIPYFLLGLTSMTMIVILAILVFGVPLRGSFFVLGLVSACFLFPAILLGLLISTISRNQLVASQASIVAGFLPAFILSGFIFEIGSMPLVIQFITHFIPARYFVSCLQTIFLTGNIWGLLLPNMIIMLLFGSVLLLIISSISVKRLD